MSFEEKFIIPVDDSVNPVSKTVDITDRASNREDENTPKIYPKSTMAPSHQPGMLATADEPKNFVGK